MKKRMYALDMALMRAKYVGRFDEPQEAIDRAATMMSIPRPDLYVMDETGICKLIDDLIAAYEASNPTGDTSPDFTGGFA